MARKEFVFYGLSLDALKNVSDDDLIKMLPSRQRRSLCRKKSDEVQKLDKKVGEAIAKVKGGKAQPNLRTHCRDYVVLPKHIGLTFNVHNGKDWVPVVVSGDMVGRYLGEFALTRKRLKHSNPGVGATKSSLFTSLK